MDNYKALKRIIHGSLRYEFDGTELTLTGYYDGNQVKLDFENMTEDILDDLASEPVGYRDAMRIFRASKEYMFKGTELVVRDYYKGDAVRLDFENMTEDMLKTLMPEEDMDDDFDIEHDDDLDYAYDNDFAFAVNNMSAKPESALVC